MASQDSTLTKDVITSAPAIRDRDVKRPASRASAESGEDKAVADEPANAGWLHWHEPNTSTEEKRLLFKLDWFLLSFSCLTYFIKQVSPTTVGSKRSYRHFGKVHSWC